MCLKSGIIAKVLSDLCLDIRQNIMLAILLKIIIRNAVQEMLQTDGQIILLDLVNPVFSKLVFQQEMNKPVVCIKGAAVVAQMRGKLM